MYYVTMQITFFTRKFRNGQHNLHCDVVHITTKLWVYRLTLDCNGVFTIKAYSQSALESRHVGSIANRRWSFVSMKLWREVYLL